VKRRAELLVIFFKLDNFFSPLMHVFYGIHELIPSENG